MLLDPAGRLRVDLDRDGRPCGVTLDGRAGRMARFDGEPASEEAVRTADVVVAPDDLGMRSAVALRRASGNPVVLVDRHGRLAGLCGDDEIYRALLRRSTPR